MHRLRIAAVLAVGLLLVAAPRLLAQLGTSQIGGKITDQQGSVLPGVAILVTNEETGVFREVTSSGEGTYFVSQIMPGRYKVLGTDGFGRSDTREKLRQFFEVDRYYVTVAALKALAEEGKIPAEKVAQAISKFGIDPDKPNPVTV